MTTNFCRSKASARVPVVSRSSTALVLIASHWPVASSGKRCLFQAISNSALVTTGGGSAKALKPVTTFLKVFLWGVFIGVFIAFPFNGSPVSH